MKLERFFEKFDQFADAPDAVAKMRELVLNLAVQGKLIQQDTADEDVEHLLARNDETRRAAAKNDRRADAENQPLLSADDRWEIAESWSWRALADLVLFVDYRGKTPAKLSNGIRLLTAKNVRKGIIHLAPEEFLSEEEYDAWMTRGFPKAGDVLFTTEAPMGNAAVVKLTDRFALAQRVICFQSYGAVDASFLVLQILSTQFQLILDKNGTGVTAKGIKASKLKQLPIAVPPLAEQKRIVAKVDELMALCDRLEAQQQERETRHAALARASLARFADAPTPANLPFLFHPSYAIVPDDIRMSILTLAIQGLLVRQAPAGDDAADYLSKPTSLQTSELPDLPSRWTWARVNETGRVDLGRQRAPQHHRGPNMRPYLRVQNVYEDRIDVSDVKTMNFTDNEFATFALMSGDILLNEGQSYKLVGRPAIYRGEVPGACFQNTLVRYRANSFVLPEYALVVFRAYMRNGRFQQISKQTTNIAHLSAGRFAMLEFPLPPLAEQRRIVAKVEQLMALVEALETQLAASRATAANLLSALVAELTTS